MVVAVLLAFGAAEWVWDVEFDVDDFVGYFDGFWAGGCIEGE